jgi:hypothetical protein
MSNRKSSMNSFTDVMIAASKFRRLSLNNRQEEGWIQRPLLRVLIKESGFPMNRCQLIKYDHLHSKHSQE